MNPIQGLISELDHEAVSTRRLLERVPADKLGWKPHEKSMTLGQLALHVATIPGRVSGMVAGEGFDVKNANFEPPVPETAAQLVAALDQGVVDAKKRLGEISAEQAMAPWTLSNGDREVFTQPRVGVARNIMLNHWYHHRGQLTVYLRLLNVPLPVTYGRSADENPFA